jgi:glycosyltransferase involved in cell wall biosynthesis
MKIGTFTGIFHPDPGGPSTYLYHLLPALQARGHEIRLLTYGERQPENYGYPVTRIPRSTTRLFHYARAARPLLNWAELAYIHTLALPLVGGSAPRIVKIVGDQAWERAIRRGWIAPTEDIDTFQTQPYGAKVTLQKFVRSNEVGRMAGVIVPSQYLKNMVIGWGVDPQKIQVIYNALPPDHLTIEMSQAEARTQLGLGAEPTILTAARLNPWKGIDHLIAALARVPDACLLVAGNGDSEMRVQLEAQAAQLGITNRVAFLGRVAREKLAVYMKAADYFALYSGYEGLSHVLLESLRAGTPVIASDKGGNPEVVQHGINGLLVPYINRDALAAALAEALRPGTRELLASNTQRGMERFDFGVMVAQTAAALEAMV